MNQNPSELEDLLAAWALGALDPVEREVIDRLIEDDPVVAEQARELAETVTNLDGAFESSPPSDLKLRIVEQAGAIAPKLAEPSSALDLLDHQIDALAELLEGLSPLDWQQIAKPYEWSVRDLVAHLLVIELYVAAELGLVDEVPSSEDHLEMGAGLIADSGKEPPMELARAWMQRARMNVDGVRAGQAPAWDVQVNFHEWSFSVEQLLVVRAFELWTHADDIRRAIGKPAFRPHASDLRTMSAMSIATLSPLLDAISPGLLQSARVVLTGDGGGTFNIGGQGAAADMRQVTLVADVVDYCHRVADRLSLQDIEFTAEGDTLLAQELLSVASAFAV